MGGEERRGGGYTLYENQLMVLSVSQVVRGDDCQG